ncbi:MAG: sigma-54-dependent transcriptional regulator [Candidatus Methylomirabilia bacterium]
MTGPTGNALQRSLERIDGYARATFGVRLTLCEPGEHTPRKPDVDGSQLPARTVGCAHGGRLRLLAHGVAIHDLAPGQLRALEDFLEMAAGLLGILADAQDAVAIDPLREQLWRDLLGAPTIAGISGPAQALRAALPSAAHSREPLFIAGEPGSGRGSIAAAVHRAGPWAAGPFVAENLAAVPETLRETGIFGSGDAPGLIGAAGGGTLYLAGVEHLSARSQERLLAYLATNAAEHPRARIVASADLDLEEAARGGRFRRDLADRLTGLLLAVPPLRERPEDIPLIAAHLLSRRAAARGATPPAIAPQALAALKMHHWAGNVDQLDEELARAGSGRTVIRLDDLPVSVSRAGRAPGAERAASLREVVGELEVELISQTLAEANWNKSRAARVLGLSRLGLQKKIDRYGIDRRR